MKLAMLTASGLCGSALAQASSLDDWQRPKVGSRRLTFGTSSDGWYWDLERVPDAADHPSGSYFVAAIVLKIHATPDDHSPVVEETRSTVMRDGDKHKQIGRAGRIEGRKISARTHYECKVYQWTK